MHITLKDVLPVDSSFTSIDVFVVEFDGRTQFLREQDLIDLVRRERASGVDRIVPGCLQSPPRSSDSPRSPTGKAR